MFRSVEQIFVSAMMLFCCNILSLNSFKLVSANNQKCKIRPELIHINSNETLFYSYNIKVIKCNDSCNNINDSFSKLCVPDVLENINVKVYFYCFSKKSINKPFETTFY